MRVFLVQAHPPWEADCAVVAADDEEQAASEICSVMGFWNSIIHPLPVVYDGQGPTIIGIYRQQGGKT